MKFRMQKILCFGLILGVILSVSLFYIFHNIENDNSDMKRKASVKDGKTVENERENIHNQQSTGTLMKEQSKLQQQNDKISERSEAEPSQGENTLKQQSKGASLKEESKLQEQNDKTLRKSETKSSQVNHGISEGMADKKLNQDLPDAMKENIRKIENEHNASDLEEGSEKEVADPYLKSDSKLSLDVAKMHLAVVACGDRLEETLVMIKSAIIMSQEVIRFHIFADDDLQPLFKKQLDTWPAIKEGKAVYTVYPITFPRGNVEQWRKLFKPCATQRLFLPDVLTQVENILYVDTDVLFVQPVEKVWAHFSKFNATHIAALAPEHEDPHVGWYNRFARHPFYPPLGVNSGVMLMALHKMKAAKWLDHIVPYFDEYRYRITWGDQDLINIFFHFFPDKLYVYPCEWNYRPDHCMYMSVCKTAEKHGVQVVHGNRGVYHNEKQPAFKAVYKSIKEHPFEKPLSDLSDSMKKNLAAAETTNCGNVGHIFTKALDAYIKKKLR